MLRNNLRAILFSIFFLSAAVFCYAEPSAGELLKRKGFAWKTAETPRFRLHFEPGTLAETRVEDLKRVQRQAFTRNMRLLEIGDFPFQVDFFIVSSLERMKQLIGGETNGVAFPTTKVVCFVYSEKINASGAHELMHVMSRNVWADNPKAWINEGLASFSGNRWHTYLLHDLSKYLLQEKKLVPLEKLIKDFRDYSPMISYPQAGSFVKYLCEQYGAGKVKQLWQSGAVKDFKRIFGKDLAALEREWHALLMQSDASKVKYEYSPEK